MITSGETSAWPSAVVAICGRLLMISYCSREMKLPPSLVVPRLSTIQLSASALRITVARRPATNPDRMKRIITTSATTDAVITLVARRTIRLRKL